MSREWSDAARKGSMKDANEAHGSSRFPMFMGGAAEESCSLLNFSPSGRCWLLRHIKDKRTGIGLNFSRRPL
jgi:hypothetical protein